MSIGSVPMFGKITHLCIRCRAMVAFLKVPEDPKCTCGTPLICVEVDAGLAQALAPLREGVMIQ